MERLRLSQKDLATVISAAEAVWVKEATIVSRGQERIVVGRSKDCPLWTALVIHEVDPAGRVWWGGIGYGKTKQKAVEEAM